MKTLISILIIALFQIFNFAQSKEKVETVEFKAAGNCGLCKNRIEKALQVEGVESASWNSKTKLVSISYQPNKVKEEKLHNIIAAVGHDTEKVRAKDEVYNSLHSCCKYDRDKSAVKEKSISKNSHKH